MSFVNIGLCDIDAICGSKMWTSTAALEDKVDAFAAFSTFRTGNTEPMRRYDFELHGFLPQVLQVKQNNKRASPFFSGIVTTTNASLVMVNALKVSTRGPWPTKALELGSLLSDAHVTPGYAPWKQTCSQ